MLLSSRCRDRRCGLVTRTVTGHEPEDIDGVCKASGSDELVGVVFSGLSALVVEGVTDEGQVIRVSARTRDDPVPCPVCGQPTGRVHGFHRRAVADVPVDGRRVMASVRLRRLVRARSRAPEMSWLITPGAPWRCAWALLHQCSESLLGHLDAHRGGHGGAGLQELVL